MKVKAVYAEHSCTEQHVGYAPSGALLMPGLRPSKDHVCFDQGDGTGIWGIDQDVVWEKDMEASDTKMSRAIEELWDAVGITKAPIYTQQIHADKKALRDLKVTKG